MTVKEIKKNKEKYIDLLLIADESEDMIGRYLDTGTMYVLFDTDARSECIVTDEGGGVLEIKSLATYPEYQGKGYARELLNFITEKYRSTYSVLQVGTGDSPLTVPFYEKQGFVRSHTVPDFFKDNYDHPIYECGVLLKDMIYLRKKI